MTLPGYAAGPRSSSFGAKREQDQHNQREQQDAQQEPCSRPAQVQVPSDAKPFLHEQGRVIRVVVKEAELPGGIGRPIADGWRISRLGDVRRAATEVIETPTTLAAADQDEYRDHRKYQFNADYPIKNLGS